MLLWQHVQLVYQTLTLLIILSHTSTLADDSYLGGSITYRWREKDGNIFAIIDVTTGWLFGHGRCGPTCDDSKLHSNITNTGTLFAKFTKNSKIDRIFSSSPIDSLVSQNGVEQVIEINNATNWEQDRLSFEFKVENETEVRLEVTGSKWSADIRGGPEDWTLYAIIPTVKRSDTNTTNNSPTLHVKPIYRVKMDAESKIKLTITDEDGDIIKCQTARQREAGRVYDKAGTGISVDEETCIITINASSSNGFKDKDMIPVTIKISDYNRIDMNLGTDNKKPNLFAISTVPVQFVVQVNAQLETPSFVTPTVEQSHLYIVYIGATWQTTVYAESKGSTIKEFIPRGFNNENVVASQLHNDRRPTVQSSVISWTPTLEDIGSHIICVKALDDDQEKSEESRCFRIEVKENPFIYNKTADNTRPYFVNFPELKQLVNCSIGAYCLLPIYISSHIEVTQVDFTVSYVDKTSISHVGRTDHTNIYVATLSFLHPTFGMNNICVNATDTKGQRSDEACLNTFIHPPDPCLSAPCLHAGRCISDKIQGTFICQCTKDFGGTFCEEMKLSCSTKPCVHGNCTIRRTKYHCDCDLGFTGTNCDTNIDDCKPDSCSHHGICKDGIHRFDCDCYERYDETFNCSKDSCELASPELLTCPAEGCFNDPCLGKGLCTTGGVCHCLKGYDTDVNCSQPIGDLNVTGIQFVDPSPANRSQYICSTVANVPCTLRLYLAHKSRGVPTVNIGKTTEQLKSTRVTTAPKLSNDFVGVTNIYSVEIEIPTNIADKDQNYICITATISSFKTIVCYELKYVTSGSQNTANIDTTFISPTPAEGSSLKCTQNETCSLLLYTSLHNTKCEDVRSTNNGVRVIQTNLMGSVCVTEALLEFSTVGLSTLYFQSSWRNFELRKFELDIVPPNSDPCSNDPCQNGGECFLETEGNYHCICPAAYIGKYCEKGPCHTNTCHQNAYCQILNETNTCICPASYQGGHCESSINQPDKQMQFTGIALPRAFTCVVYKECNFPLISTSSTITPGYVSYVLQINSIRVSKFDDNGNFMVSVQIISKKVGTFDVCLQTLDEDGMNQDELCVKITAVTDVSSLYGQKNLPHFIEPSLPTNAEVECVEGESCHILYHITNGETTINDDMTLVATKDDEFAIYNIYSKCQSPDGHGNINTCTADISIVTEGKDVNTTRRFCTVITYGNDKNGEGRCFDLTVVGATNANSKGCQTLHCHNGGFCDGHDPVKPLCYCRRGFTGENCTTVVSPQAVFGGEVQTPFYVGQLGLPAEIQCLVRQTCVIPYQFVAKPGQEEAPDIFLGYVHPDIIVEGPTMDADSKSNGVFFGSTTSVPLTEGVFKVCLQSLSDSKKIIEQCLDITSVDSIEEKIDMTKPHFVQPTVPTETLLLCEVYKNCHIDIHFTNGNDFGFPGQCPIFTDKSPEHIEGLHIFKSEYGTSRCTSDVTFIPSTNDVTHTFCIQLSFPGKKGETRCFTIKVVTDLSQNVTHPCTGMVCENNGKCIADFNKSPAVANCVCSYGYDGTNCEQELVDNGHIVGFEVLESKLDFGQRFDVNSAVPNNTRCYKTEDCCISVAYFGVSKHPPILESSDILMKETLTYTPVKTMPTRHIAKICIEGDVGEHILCLQSTNDGTKAGVVTDEFCLEIEILSGGEHPIQALPHFKNSFSNGSILSCHADSNCHFSMFTEKTKDETCDQVRVCDTRIGETFVFPTQDADNLCMTDIAVKTGALNHMDEICVTAGVDGEKRVVSLESTCPLEVGYCDRSYCLNIATCLPADPEEILCVCDKNFTGTSCKEVKIVKASITEEGVQIARNNTLSEDGKCNCIVKEKEETGVDTIAVVKSAGMGAGGMASAMGIGGALFAIINKLKKHKKSQIVVTPSAKGKQSEKPHKA